MKTVKEQLDEINNRNLNLAIGFATVCTLLARIVSFSWNIRNILSPFSLTISILTIVFLLVFLFRRRLTYQAKMYTLLVIIFALFCLGLTNRALFSPVLSFLVIIPLVQSYIGSFRLAVTVNVILLLLFIGIGALILNTPELLNHEWDSLMMNPWIWITDITIIFTITLATLMIGRSNNDLLIRIHSSLEDQRLALDGQTAELRALKSNLEKMVADRTRELQQANQTLLDTNIRVAEKNLEIAWKNEETEKALAEIRRIEKDLMESDKLASVGMFAHGITRNISAPIGTFSVEQATINALLAAEPPEKRKSISEFTAILNDGVTRLSRVLSDLEKMGGSHPKESADLKTIALSAIHAVQAAARPKAEILLVDPGISVSVQGNAARLERIFINLITNAWHAVEKIADGRIVIRFSDNEDGVTATVEDNGHGISSDLLKRITEPFFTTKEPGKGTGLGLFLCQSLMHDMGGRLEIDSEEGKGTRMMLRFPKTQSTH